MLWQPTCLTGSCILSACGDYFVVVLYWLVSRSVCVHVCVCMCVCDIWKPVCRCLYLYALVQRPEETIGYFVLSLSLCLVLLKWGFSLYLKLGWWPAHPSNSSVCTIRSTGAIGVYVCSHVGFLCGAYDSNPGPHVGVARTLKHRLSCLLSTPVDIVILNFCLTVKQFISL